MHSFNLWLIFGAVFREFAAGLNKGLKKLTTKEIFI